MVFGPTKIYSCSLVDRSRSRAGEGVLRSPPDSRASATKLVKHGLREVLPPPKPSEVLGVYIAIHDQSHEGLVSIQAPFLSKVTTFSDSLGEPSKECVVFQPSSKTHAFSPHSPQDSETET